MQQKKQQEKNK